MKICLTIGGYRIVVEEPKDRDIYQWPVRFYIPFLDEDTGSPDIHFKIKLVRKFSDPPKTAPLFSSNNDFWKIYSDSGGYFVECRRPENGSLLIRSWLTKDFRSIFSEVRERKIGGSSKGSWAPAAFFNPLLELVLNLKLAYDGGLFLHSSGVLTEDGVFVFCGPSGAGKSTIAEIFLKRGYRVLNDERLIIRFQGGEFKAYGTPWPGSSYLYSNACGNLKRLFLISHGQEMHKATLIPKAKMTASLMQQTYLPHWDQDALASLMRFYESLLAKNGCWQLSFLNDVSVADFVMSGRDLSSLAIA